MCVTVGDIYIGMAFLQPDIVQFSCTCGYLKPIARMYFCRHCLKIRCGNCVCHEVESHYCANCLENLPSAEARLKKNRCASCFDCPSCFHTVSTRTLTTSAANPDDPNKPIIKKAYYLICGFCRWTTRDAGIPDQSVATGGWPERENLNSARINSLLEYYKILALRERQEKERKKFTPRRSYLNYTDKFGLSAVMARKRAGLPPLGGIGLKDNGGSISEPLPAEATEEVEQLPQDIFTEPVNLYVVTTVPQRLAQPDVQPSLVSQLLPLHKHLLIKRSQRCRTCEHNVSKPEFSPISIKFKIQLSAYYHVPEVRVVTCEPLRPGERSQLIIKLCNPTQHQTTIQFVTLVAAAAEEEQEEVVGEEEVKELEVTQFAGGKLSMLEDAHIRNICLSADVDLPDSSVVLPPRDDAAEYDDSGDTHNFQDDPKVVVWRKANKVALKMGVVPYILDKDGNMGDGLFGNKVQIGFVMKYTYVNTMASLDHKGPQKVDLKVKVFLKIGKTVGAE